MRALLRRPWPTSLLVGGVSLAASLWLWFGPWLWTGIPWLVAALLPFLVGFFSPRIPLVFAVLVAVVPYLIEGRVQAPLLVGGVGAAYLASALGLVFRRLYKGVLQK